MSVDSDLHLLGIDGMKRSQIEEYLSLSEHFMEVNERAIQKVSPLRGRTIINFFMEPSTRTRTSFEIAGKRLNAEVINVSKEGSSSSKGETLYDTARTLEAMSPDIIVMRHPSSGSPHFLSRELSGVSVINAGDGMHEHPTQALLDALTVRRQLGRLEGLKILLVGDAFRSRVARSNIHLHRLFGNSVRIVSPPTLAVDEFKSLGVEVFYDLREALIGVDLVMSLRMKHEYLHDHFIPNLDEYTKGYFISEDILAKYAPNARVLAPGPFIRGVEIASDVIDGPRSLYDEQVTCGVATRMAVLTAISAKKRGISLDEMEI